MIEIFSTLYFVLVILANSYEVKNKANAGPEPIYTINHSSWDKFTVAIPIPAKNPLIPSFE